MTCEKCREFSYCSIECLELDMSKHEPQCDFISLKKGTAHLLDRDVVMSVRRNAKPLDDEGNIAGRENTPDDLDKTKEPKASQRASEATNKRKPRKRRNRKKGQGKTTDVSGAKKTSSPAPDTASLIAGGKFGGKVIVDREARSGTTFGAGWWKPKNEKTNESAKVDATSGASVKKEQSSRFPEYDTDTDSGDDGSGPGINAREVSTVPSRKPVDVSLLSEKLKDDQGSDDKSNVKAIDNDGSATSAPGDEVKASEQVGRVKDRSATSNTGTAEGIQGGIASNTGSEGGKVKDSEPVSSETGAANTEDKHGQGQPTTTGVELVPYDKQKAGEAEAAAGGRDQREPPKLEKCLSCHKESYTMLKCSRCKIGRYCNKSCQKEDFPKHKERCKRTGVFVKALHHLPFGYLLSETMRTGGPRLSTRLRDLSHEFEYLFLGVRRSILLMILGPYFHPFRHGVVVMDQEGVKTHIMFYNQLNMYFHVSDEMFGLGLPIPLTRCLKPGNFILLLNACRHVFLDGTVGIRVDDLQDVHFVFMD